MTNMLVLLIVTSLSGTVDASVGRDKRDDDVSLASLKTIVEQQASLIQSLQAQLTATKNDLAATKADLAAVKTDLGTTFTSMNTRFHTLESTVQNQQSKIALSATAVAFSARFADNHDSPDHGISLGNHQTLIFDVAATNIGQGYDASTGVFVVPVAGTYAFFLKQMTPNTHVYLQLVIVKNGAELDHEWTQGTYSGGDQYDQGSTLITTHCAKGDKVWVRQDQGDAARASWWTEFSGFLLHADV